MLLLPAIIRHIAEHENGCEENVERRQHEEYGKGEDDVRHSDLPLRSWRRIDVVTCNDERVHLVTMYWVQTNRYR